MTDIMFTITEVAKLAEHCQDFYPTEGFDRTRFTAMMMQVLGLMTAESMVNPSRYGAEVSLEDVEKNSRKMVGIVQGYINLLEKNPNCLYVDK